MLLPVATSLWPGHLRVDTLHVTEESEHGGRGMVLGFQVTGVQAKFSAF